MTPDMYLLLPLYAVCAVLGLNALLGLCSCVARVIRNRHGGA